MSFPQQSRRMRGLNAKHERDRLRWEEERARLLAQVDRVERLARATDETNRRIAAMYNVAPVGTLSGMTALVDAHVPCAMDPFAMRVALACHWLRPPRGFFARLRWLFSTMRALWRQ